MTYLSFTVILATLLLAGCSSNPPSNIQPTGELTPVNPINIDINDLRIK